MFRRISIIVSIIAIIVLLKMYYSNYTERRAMAAVPMLTTSGMQLLEKISADSNLLNPYLDKVIAFDAAVCEYYVAPNGENILKLTAFEQADSCLWVARPLRVTTLAQKAVWDPCDSSAASTYNLFNLQETTYKLYITLELEKDSMPLFTYNTTCNRPGRFHNDHDLENFCYDKVSCKAVLNSVTIENRNIYLTLDQGIVLNHERLKRKANYRKRL